MKQKKEEKKGKLMFWVEVYGGKRSLAFELTTAIYDWRHNHDKHALGAMATMDDYASSQVM